MLVNDHLESNLIVTSSFPVLKLYKLLGRLSRTLLNRGHLLTVIKYSHLRILSDFGRGSHLRIRAGL